MTNSTAGGTETSMACATDETPKGNTAGPLGSKPNFRAIVPGPSADHNMDTKSRQPKMRCTSLHQLVFKDHADLASLTYMLKNGRVLKKGHKKGACIVCRCCNEEFTPSQFEDHAGNGQRRQPYYNIYTSEGITLHEMALKSQDFLNSNRISEAHHCDTDEDLDFASSSSSEEYNISNGPTIVPLKRTLQERLVGTESCHFCGARDRVTLIRCYKQSGYPQDEPQDILNKWLHFEFLCCQKCQLFRICLDHILNGIQPENSEMFWQLLKGWELTNVQQFMMHQATEIFRDAFPEDIIQDMVNAKYVGGEKDFRGMYCAVLTRGSELVVSAALLKVRTAEFAELVLVATCKNYREKGYFTLLLSLIEEQLDALNVRFLVAPVDPEMAGLWSQKYGFTILSDAEKNSLLEAHPLVMFEDLTLVQKSIAR